MDTSHTTVPFDATAQPLPRASERSRARRHGERWRAACVVLAAVAVSAALATPFFLGRVYVADDLGAFHLPLRSFYAQQLQAGEPFDWMPSLYGGFYLTGEGQLGVYHPLHQALYRNLPLGAAFDIELLISYPLMLAGTYWFFRRRVGRRDAALFGSLAFTFGSFNLLHFVHPNAVAVVAQLPWQLLAIDVALRSSDRKHVALAEAALALLVASQLLLGYPQYVWLSLLAMTALAAWLVWRGHGNATRVGLLTWSLVLGVLCAGVQLLPTIDLLGDSVRRSADAAFAASGSWHPLNLVQLIAPYLFASRVVGQNTHELGCYIGAAPLLLCVWLAADYRQSRRWRGGVIALAVLCGLALLLAFGEFGGLLYLQSWLPLVNRFRFACRALVLVQLCLALGAAVAVARLFQQSRASGQTGNQGHWRAIALTVLASVLLAIVGPMLWPQYVASSGQVWLGPALMTLAAGCVWLVARGYRAGWVALVALTALDLSAYGLSYSVVGRTADLQEYVATTPRPPQRGSQRIAAATAPGSTLRVGDRVLLTGMTRVDGYAGLEPAKRLDYSQLPVLRLAGTTWLWSASAADPAARSAWTKLDDPAPRARLISRVAPAAALRDIASLGLEAAAIEPTVELPALPQNAALGIAMIAIDRPGRLAIDVHTPVRQVLATTEGYHSGWRATQAGRELQVVRVNGDFLGCIVEPGNGRVELEFRPASLRAGMVASWCGLGLIVCTLAIRLPLTRRSRPRGFVKSCPGPITNNC